MISAVVFKGVFAHVVDKDDNIDCMLAIVNRMSSPTCTQCLVFVFFILQIAAQMESVYNYLLPPPGMANWTSMWVVRGGCFNPVAQLNTPEYNGTLVSSVTYCHRGHLCIAERWHNAAFIFCSIILH